MSSIIVHNGDLLSQEVEVIVNPWNSNYFSWWPLIPIGTASAIKKKGGEKPFRQLKKVGKLELGQAVITNPGDLPFKAIIHVEGVNSIGQSTKELIVLSIRNVMKLVNMYDIDSVAFPLIGASKSGLNANTVFKIMAEELSMADTKAVIHIVKAKRK